MILENVKYRSDWSDGRLIEYYWISVSILSDNDIIFLNFAHENSNVLLMFSFQVVDNLSKINYLHIRVQIMLFFFFFFCKKI